jgi:hypothetical protein
MQFWEFIYFGIWFLHGLQVKAQERYFREGLAASPSARAAHYPYLFPENRARARARIYFNHHRFLKNFGHGRGHENEE